MLINSMCHFTPGPMNALPNYQINDHIVYMYGCGVSGQGHVWDSGGLGSKPHG